MALFMPSQIVPDMRSGLGLGVIDATQDLTVSWKINGSSAMSKFQITIYLNDADSTQVYTTGELTTGCPAYGTSSSGEIQLFSYTIPAADLSTAGITNGNEYKLIIKQFWQGSTVSITNLIQDNNFANTGYWSGYNANYSVSGNVATSAVSGSQKPYPQLYKDGITTTSGHIYYVRAEMKYNWTSGTNPTSRGSVVLKDANNTIYVSSSQTYPLDNTWCQLSARGAFNAAAGNVDLMLPANSSNYGYTGVSVLWQKPMLIDLTAAYGAGNEPSLAECDAMGYFQGTTSAGTSQSVTQMSASVFQTREDPTLSIDAIGTGGVIGTRYYTFTGSYTQAQSEALNWFRWQIAYQNNRSDPFFDSGNITGTMNLSCYFDGFFTATDYSIRLTAQTESGVEADTGWVDFSASYTLQDASGTVSADCTAQSDAVVVKWDFGYVPGTPSGPYTIGDDYILYLPSGSSITWDTVNTNPMSYADPWTVVWKGKLGNVNADIFTIGQTGNNVVLSYDFANQSLVLKKGTTTLATQTGIINTPTVTVVLTASNMYIRSEYMYGGLYPSNTLYPGNSLYPQDDTQDKVDTYTKSVSYTQSAISSVTLGGYQECVYIEALSGTVDADFIAAAITNGTYVPELTASTYMMTQFENGLNAGNISIGGDTIEGYAVYRQQGSSGRLIKVSDTSIAQDSLYDYGATSQQGPYTYYVFPIGTNTYIASPIVSDPISPCWWNWTLMECMETANNEFSVLAAYRFRNNVASGAIGNNNSPNLLQNFTPYPKIQLAPQNYKSGSLTALIGIVDYSSGQPEYVDTIALRDKIFALSVTQNPLFLKNRKGDLIRVRISGAISMQTGDDTREQTQTVTLPWAEVASAKAVSLYALQNVGVAP